jgi:hypothetical protein
VGACKHRNAKQNCFTWPQRILSQLLKVGLTCQAHAAPSPVATSSRQGQGESTGGVFDGVFGACVLDKDEKNGCCCTKDRSPRQHHYSWQVLRNR